MLSSSRRQGNFRGLEASRPKPRTCPSRPRTRPRTSKCVLEAKDVLEDSTSDIYTTTITFDAFWCANSPLISVASKEKGAHLWSSSGFYDCTNSTICRQLSSPVVKPFDLNWGFNSMTLHLLLLLLSVWPLNKFLKEFISVVGKPKQQKRAFHIILMLLINYSNYY